MGNQALSLKMVKRKTFNQDSQELKSYCSNQSKWLKPGSKTGVPSRTSDPTPKKAGASGKNQAGNANNNKSNNNRNTKANKPSPQQLRQRK